MCGLHLRTDLLLACFFASENSHKIGAKCVNIKVIEKLAIYLANNLPGYVSYDLSEESIEKVVYLSAVKAKYEPRDREGKEVVSYYYFRYKDGNVFYNDSKYLLDFNYYLSLYPTDLVDKITIITNSFFENKRYLDNDMRLTARILA